MLRLFYAGGSRIPDDTEEAAQGFLSFSANELGGFLRTICGCFR